MKVGDLVGSYVLTTDLTTVGGGQSQWGFARRGDVEYFIKRFLAPTYPLPESPGSEKTKADKRARCEIFERQHSGVTDKLRPISGDGGNLVVTKDFFRDGAHYYKVTEKIDVSGLESHDIAAMEEASRLLVMLTAVHSMETLHFAGLVHGDIKPANVLIKQIGSNFSAKIIDFDNCFVSREPPPPEELVGDPAYYSPELMQYILDGAAPEKLSVKADVFALGLVFWEYVTGARPEMLAPYTYPADAAAAGKLPLPKLTAKSDPVGQLIESMLEANADSRPSMKEVHSALKRIRRYGRPDAPLVGGSIGDGLKRVASLGGTMWLRRLSSAPDRAAEDGPILGGGAPAPPGELGGTLWRRRRGGAETPPSGVLGGTLWARRRADGAPGEAEEGGEPARPDTTEESSAPPGADRRLRGSLIKKNHNALAVRAVRKPEQGKRQQVCRLLFRARLGRDHR